MGRAVTPVAKPGAGAEGQGGEGDGARTQLVKYFPAETGSLYVGLTGVVLETTEAHTDSRMGWLLGIFIVLLLGTVWDLNRLYPASVYAKRWIPIAVGLGAFAMWAYEVRGLAEELKIFNGLAAAVLPALYAFIAIRAVPEKAAASA